MIQIQTGNMLDVVVEGKSLGLKQRDSDHRKYDVIWLPAPEGLRDVLAKEIERLNPATTNTTEIVNSKGEGRVPFCCDYHDRYGDHCLFRYQAARPPKATDKARTILNCALGAGAAVPSWNTGQRQQSEVTILAAIDAELTTIRNAERTRVWEKAVAVVKEVNGPIRFRSLMVKLEHVVTALQAAANDEAKGD